MKMQFGYGDPNAAGPRYAVGSIEFPEQFSGLAFTVRVKQPIPEGQSQERPAREALRRIARQIDSLANGLDHGGKGDTFHGVSAIVSLEQSQQIDALTRAMGTPLDRADVAQQLISEALIARVVAEGPEGDAFRRELKK